MGRESARVGRCITVAPTHATHVDAALFLGAGGVGIASLGGVEAEDVDAMAACSQLAGEVLGMGFDAAHVGGPAVAEEGYVEAWFHGRWPGSGP